MSVSLQDYSSEYALLYDLITEHKNYKSESLFLFETIKQLCLVQDSSRLLSIGCGTGGHEIYLEKYGLNVFGIDTSAPMIQRAKAKPFKRAIFASSSINNFSVSHHSSFDVAVSLFNVVNCLPDINSLVEFFASTSYALKVNSLLYFECWNMLPCILEPPEVVVRIFSDSSHSYKLKRVAVPTLKAAMQRLTIDYNIQGFHDGKRISLQSTHNLTLFSQIEYMYALEKAGFHDIVFGPSLADRANLRALDDNTRMVGVSAMKRAT